MTDKLCCLCGLPYERIGNNPHPLYAGRGRCCDACDQIVVQARIDPAVIQFELERVAAAIARMPRDPALAAICASRGPELLARKKVALAELKRLYPSGDDA